MHEQPHTSLSQPSQGQQFSLTGCEALQFHRANLNCLLGLSHDTHCKKFERPACTRVSPSPIHHLPEECPLSSSQCRKILFLQQIWHFPLTSTFFIPLHKAGELLINPFPLPGTSSHGIGALQHLGVSAWSSKTKSRGMEAHTLCRRLCWWKRTQTKREARTHAESDLFPRILHWGNLKCMVSIR